MLEGSFPGSAWCHLCEPDTLWLIPQLARHVLEVHEVDVSGPEFVGPVEDEEAS